MGVLQREDHGSWCVVAIDRPARRNSLRPRDVVELCEALAELERRPELRCIVLGGTGGWLCAGGDLAEDVATGPAEGDRHVGEFQRLVRAVVGLRLPVVVVLEGAAIGAGAALALAADVCVAAPTSRITLPWVRRGLVPDAGVAFLLARAIGAARTKSLLLSGRSVAAPEALAWGLLAEIDDDPWAAARRWAEQLAANPPLATSLTKRLVNEASSAGIDSYLNLERASMAAILGTSEPSEGMAAFAARRSGDLQP